MCPERGRKIIDELVNTCIIPQAQNPIYACYCPQFLVLLIPSPLLLTTRRQVRGLALAAHRRARPPLTSLCASLSSPLPRSWWPPLPEVPIVSAPSPCCCSHAGPRPGRCLRQPGRQQRCRPHCRRCKPSGSQSPAMGGRLAAVQKLGKDTGMTILCFF